MAVLTAVIAWRGTRSLSSEPTVSSSVEPTSPSTPADAAPSGSPPPKPTVSDVAPSADATKEPSAVNAIARTAVKDTGEKSSDTGALEKSTAAETAKSPAKSPESKPPAAAEPARAQSGPPTSYAVAKPLSKDGDANVKPGGDSAAMASSGAAKQPAQSAKPTPSPSAAKLASPPGPDPFGPMASELVEPAAHLPTAEIKKLAPVEVDVNARLADRIPEISMSGLPLSKACDLLASIGCLPITLDLDAMSSLGVSPRDPVSVRLASTTVGQARQAVAEKCRLAASIESGQVLVTAPAEYRETRRRVRYTVSDLTGDGATFVAELAGMVRRLVAPQSWQVDGGQGAVEADGAACW